MQGIGMDEFGLSQPNDGEISDCCSHIFTETPEVGTLMSLCSPVLYNDK